MIDTQSKHKNIQLGHRVRVQENIGTVKYIGELDGQKGIWLGVDWDDPSRGKHDGSVHGKRYFTASTPTSGSFLRPEKVSTGISLIESITSRYGHQEDETEMKYYQYSFSQFEHEANMPFLKCIGFDDITSKQSNYKQLTVLTVRLTNVSFLGDPQQFSALCPNVEELDLSKNMLHSWVDVFNLASALQHLHNLNLSENKLLMPEDISSYKIPNLKTLIFGTMDLTWKEIEQLAQVFPNLETLIAPHNNITTLLSSQPLNILFQNLKVLDIEGNPITSWDEIMRLEQLPKLETLHLPNLKISNIRIPSDREAFKSLQLLNIRHNQISDLESLSNLNNLKNLTTLAIAGSSLYALDTHLNVNQIIIAMIASLRVLNGSADIERKGAEIDYMKKFGLEWLQVQQNDDARHRFLSVHTRYLQLVQKYGAMEEGELKAEAKTIRESLIEVNLVYEGRQVCKKVPPTLVVQKLVTLCQRLFRLPAAPTLVYVGEGQAGVQFELEESHEIGLYSIQSGDKIVVKC